MRGLVAVCLGWLWLVINPGVALAQGWPPWADGVFGERPRQHAPRWEEPNGPRRPPVNWVPRVERSDLRDGGAWPDITAVSSFVVPFRYDYPANSIVIDTGGRKLFYVLPEQRAYAYPISVGREGFNWTGTETISRKQAWPDWYPPQEMRERDPSLPEKMTGGIKNPLGAMALYLGNTLYRIHGTNDVKSIGQAQSSGCFRMLNSAVLHLASIAEVGTTVQVVSSLPRDELISRAPAQPIAPRKPETQPAQQLASPEHTSAEVQGDRLADYRSLRAYTLERQ